MTSTFLIFDPERQVKSLCDQSVRIHSQIEDTNSLIDYLKS